jgi:hypothetical protein
VAGNGYPRNERLRKTSALRRRFIATDVIKQFLYIAGLLELSSLCGAAINRDEASAAAIRFVTSALPRRIGPLIRTYSAVEPAVGSDWSQAQPELLIDRCWYQGSAMPQRDAPIAMTLIATTAGFLPASNTLLLIHTT